MRTGIKPSHCVCVCVCVVRLSQFPPPCFSTSWDKERAQNRLFVLDSRFEMTEWFKLQLHLSWDTTVLLCCNDLITNWACVCWRQIVFVCLLIHRASVQLCRMRVTVMNRGRCLILDSGHFLFGQQNKVSLILWTQSSGVQQSEKLCGFGLILRFRCLWNYKNCETDRSPIIRLSVQLSNHLHVSL